MRSFIVGSSAVTLFVLVEKVQRLISYQEFLPQRASLLDTLAPGTGTAMLLRTAECPAEGGGEGN